MTAPATVDGGKNKINSVHGGGSLLEREIDHFLSVAISATPQQAYLDLVSKLEEAA